MDDLALLRSFEPVVRLAQGEFFVPVGVDAYVRRSALWSQTPDGEALVVAEPGALDLGRLAEFGARLDGPGQSLSGITVPSSRWARLRGMRARRPKFRAGARLAQVGLLGRSIDTLSRFSLLLRGAVPGGSATLSLEIQNDHLRPDRPVYHGRVVRDGDWVVCQYWLFYAFNNWRSGFSGVNEHEADWEQVTIYLDGTGHAGGASHHDAARDAGADAPDEGVLPAPRWVVFSAHDETGDDLRRRWDDPDLTLVDGRHPVMFAGAGSHSGSYLAGDYLITVEPPTLGGVVPTVRQVAKVLVPWTRAAQGSGFGIPYIDYARGDGTSIGPGQELPWTPVVIDDDLPWVRDYRGLWGHDTRDRLGGERGPAGPRYERDGTVRASWGDPVGWAGLAKVAPNATIEQALVTRRIQEIDAELERLELDTANSRRTMATRVAGLAPGSAEVRLLEDDERGLVTARMAAVRLRDERERLRRARRDGVAVADPHAHLRHRRTPIEASSRGRSRLLNGWAVVSTPLVLWLVSVLLRPNVFARGELALGLIVAVLSVEAFARGYLLAFLGRLLLLFLLLNLIVLFVGNWQLVTAGTLAVLALVILVVNIRDGWRR